ncbi:unnamed protein product [Symbiodinium sp. CCMP2592]|nr:unnamed protein product [Symbiodinium sp. CCMP2592]
MLRLPSEFVTGRPMQTVGDVGTKSDPKASSLKAPFYGPVSTERGPGLGPQAPLAPALVSPSGIVPVIKLVRSLMVKSKVPFPLELGCKGPQCLPSFLERMKNDELIDIGKSIKISDIAKVLREAPEAATALLRYVRGPQEFRMDVYLTEYQYENNWSFDPAAWRPPGWHEPWVDRSPGKPIIDAEIRVCLIADLICPEVFAALVDPKNADFLQLYEDDTIHAMVKHLFWKAAAKIDLTSVLLSFWSLALLLAEEGIIRTNTGSDLDAETERRLIRGTGAGTFGGSHSNLSQMQRYTDEISEASWVAYTWIACKALVDLLLEFAEFYGFWKIGRWRDWFTVANIVRAFAAGLPSVLLIAPTCEPVLICAVFLYWMRLLGCFTLMQYIGVELLPIMDLASGLGPSLFVTAIAYGAFTHAFYVVRGSAQALWPSVSTDTFAVLITAALPETAEGVSALELVLVLVAVLFFTVLIMNVFIGVICDLYNRAKEQAELQFQKRRAESCLLYLLRMQLIPSGLVSENVALFIIMLSGGIGLSFQVYFFDHHDFNPWVVLPFFLCQLSIAICSMQSPGDLWVNSKVGGSDVNGYLWFCKAKVAEEGNTQLENVHEQLEEMTLGLVTRERGNPKCIATTIIAAKLRRLKYGCLSVGTEAVKVELMDFKQKMQGLEMPKASTRAALALYRFVPVLLAGSVVIDSRPYLEILVNLQDFTMQIFGVRSWGSRAPAGAPSEESRGPRACAEPGRGETRHRPGSPGLCPWRSSCREAALSHSPGACPGSTFPRSPRTKRTSPDLCDPRSTTELR